ncbi:hydantoinase/oxoprolinase family protein [Paeniglutamicibacter sp.]|uniref:hydantoinase/oxoprolinase family protein n=1 Tax=Paeniglutamicibacter sp. TaxID=1934391 RepID=UPI00398A2870
MTLTTDIPGTLPDETTHGWSIGTDVGGTFTDLWLRSPSGESYVCKSPTTADVVTGVVNAVHLAADLAGLGTQELCAKVQRFGHGTTVGLNALLTGRSAKTGLITTRGFGDVLEIGRLRRGTASLKGMDLGDYFLRGQVPPLVPRELVVEVNERVDANGNVLTPLDLASVEQAAEILKAEGVEAVAICLLWATERPEHEQAVAEVVARILPEAFLSMSHVIAPSVGEYARASTTTANAALGPIAGHYLLKLERELRELGMTAPIMMTTSAGGVVPAAAITSSPVNGLLSGPASCVVAGQSLGKEQGLPNILTMDVGGTSFDVGVVVQGVPLLREAVTFGGADMRVPSVDIASVGAGGGSIASVDGGILSVGPRSAGATPGPVCYGKGGTEPTTTDADLVLGVLDPEAFSSGGIILDRDAAARAIEEQVGRPLGLNAVEAARAIRMVFDTTMSDLLRSVTIERGHDPREFTLVAGGGSGPSHAWALCRELGMEGFLVPATATAQSAYGAGTSDLKTTSSRTSYIRLSSGLTPQAEHAQTLAHALASTSTAVLDSVPDPDHATLTHSAAVRYHGQANHLDVYLPQAPNAGDVTQMLSRFEADYELLFGAGAGFREAGFEILSVRSIASRSTPAQPSASNGELFEELGVRQVVFEDPDVPEATRIYSCRWPAGGQTVFGPCLINLPGCVVVVPPNGSAATDDAGVIHVKVGIL